MKKIDIIIKLDKKVLERLSNSLSCILSLSFLKSFTVAETDLGFFSHNYIATTSFTSGK